MKKGLSLVLCAVLIAGITATPMSFCHAVNLEFSPTVDPVTILQTTALESRRGREMFGIYTMVSSIPFLLGGISTLNSPGSLYDEYGNYYYTGSYYQAETYLISGGVLAGTGLLIYLLKNPVEVKAESFLRNMNKMSPAEQKRQAVMMLDELARSEKTARITSGVIIGGLGGLLAATPFIGYSRYANIWSSPEFLMGSGMVLLGLYEIFLNRYPFENLLSKYRSAAKDYAKAEPKFDVAVSPQYVGGVLSAQF